MDASGARVCFARRICPLAEETGMIVEMGRWALEVGLRDHLVMLDAFKKAFPDKNRLS